MFLHFPVDVGFLADDDHPRGVLVEAMAEPGHDLFGAGAGGVVPVMEVIDQGVVNMAPNRVDKHSRRLVDCNEPFIFVDDVELAL